MLKSNVSEVAHHYIIASLAKQVLQNDLKNIKACKFPEVYLPYIKTIEAKLNKELRHLRAQMNRDHLRVQEWQRITLNEEVVFLITHDRYTSKETYWTVALRNATRDYLISIIKSL